MQKRLSFGLTLTVALVVSLCSMPAHAGVLFGGSNAPTFQTLTVATELGSVTFTTGASEFTPNVPNQGWWSDIGDNSDTSANYAVGDHSNNFFTFDLSGFEGRAIGALLSIRTGGTGTEGLPLTYYLYDVGTDPATLNFNTGHSAAIFGDLGSGALYGSISVGPYPDPLAIALNASGVADINSHAGSFFSIGGTLTPSAAPEPGTLAMGGLAITGLALKLRRRRR